MAAWREGKHIEQKTLLYVLENGSSKEKHKKTIKEQQLLPMEYNYSIYV